MRYRALPLLSLALLAALALFLPAAVSHAQSSTPIRLRRATFDPLQRAPNLDGAMQARGASTLLLVQFAGRPGEQDRATLTASGLRVLAYIPENTYLVRASDGAPRSAAALPGVRWIGPFHPAYKLPASLDGELAAADGEVGEFTMFAAQDANPVALEAAIRAAGGSVQAQQTLMTGRWFRLAVPRSALPGLLARDDVLWIDRSGTAQLHNDRGREVLGVDQARATLPNLDGRGQVVAVTDSGLDTGTTATVSADFAGRVQRGFSRLEMSASCTAAGKYPTTWSDRHGHGTHVAGTLLGNGSLGGSRFAGVAPGASIVVQAASSGGSTLDCLPDPSTYLGLAYDAGARIQNGSFGYAADGAYDDEAALVDDFLWRHKDHLFIVSAGNLGSDVDRNGVVDGDAIGSPASAKNVVSVGATESRRPEEPFMWGYSYGVPIQHDLVADNPNGMAAFSSRGPADDGRIKPEISAPGTEVISAASHEPAAAGKFYRYDDNYAYSSGTSMAAPMVSGLAALVRQWLAEQRGHTTPSAALVKALLTNGATNTSPGQYGTGATREIPAAWPNNVQGWGRASLPGAIGLGGTSRVWLTDNTSGLAAGASTTYVLNVTGDEPLRITLAWTDYPAVPAAARALVNDLDLEVSGPGGSPVTALGNATAELSSDCRSGGADRCNNLESVQIDAPQPGTYTVRVRAHAVEQGPQPYALVARAGSVGTALSAPTLTAAAAGGTGPVINVSWNAVAGATRYEVEERVAGSPAYVFATRSNSLSLVRGVGTYAYRVRACDTAGCSAYSAPLAEVSVTEPPVQVWLGAAHR